MSEVTKRIRRKVGGSGNYVKFNDMSPGDYFIGKYVEKGFDNKYKKDKYTIEIENASTSALTHAGKEIEEGMRVTLNEMGSLAYAIKNVAIGEVIEIVYNGKEALPENHTFAGVESHQVDVFICGEEEEAADESDEDL